MNTEYTEGQHTLLQVTYLTCGMTSIHIILIVTHVPVDPQVLGFMISIPGDLTCFHIPMIFCTDER